MVPISQRGQVTKGTVMTKVTTVVLVAAGLGVKLSRTGYRHPEGNAFIERLYRTSTRNASGPNDFASFDEARAAIAA